MRINWRAVTPQQNAPFADSRHNHMRFHKVPDTFDGIEVAHLVKQFVAIQEAYQGFGLLPEFLV